MFRQRQSIFKEFLLINEKRDYFLSKLLVSDDDDDDDDDADDDDDDELFLWYG